MREAKALCVVTMFDSKAGDDLKLRNGVRISLSFQKEREKR
jgi:hypothetical protein